MPFKTVTVRMVVDWDCDEGDESPDEQQTGKFTPEELEEHPFECLDRKDTAEWSIDKEKFEDGLSEYLTDKTKFCNNGFSYSYWFDYSTKN